MNYGIWTSFGWIYLTTEDFRQRGTMEECQQVLSDNQDDDATEYQILPHAHDCMEVGGDCCEPS